MLSFTTNHLHGTKSVAAHLGTLALMTVVVLSGMLVPSAHAQINPVQINPAQINPVQINPVQINPVRINPIRLHGVLDSSAHAQINPTIVIRNSGDLQKANDSIRKLLEQFVTDSVQFESVNIELDNPPTPQSTTKSTVVEVSGGRVTIVSNSQGQVIKTTYEGTTNKPKRKTIFWDSYIDLSYNRTSSRNIFTGAENSNAGDFPNLLSNRSVSFAMYPALVGIRFPGNRFSFVTGLGLEWLNFRFTNNMTLRNKDGITAGAPVSEVFEGVNEVSKSKLMSSYLNLPLWFKFIIPSSSRGRSRHANNFYLLAGPTLGINLNHHTKIVHNSNGSRRRDKSFEDLNVAPLRYGFTFRAGYGVFGFTAAYYMTPLFSKGEGPQVYPYLIGISLSLF